jgi:hypothetical protein
MDQIDKTQGVYKWSSYTDPNAVRNIDTAFKRGLFCGVAVQMRFGAEYIRTDANPEESPSWKAINYELSQNKVEGKSFQFIVLMCNSKACGSGDTDTNIWEALAFYRNLFVKHYPKTQVFIGMDKDFWEKVSTTVATRFFHSSQSTPLVVFGNEDPLIVTDNLNSFPYTDNMAIYTPASFKTSDGLFAFVGYYKMGGLRYSLIKWFGNEQNMIDKLGFTPVNYSAKTTPEEPETDPETPENNNNGTGMTTEQYNTLYGLLVDIQGVSNGVSSNVAAIKAFVDGIKGL